MKKKRWVGNRNGDGEDPDPGIDSIEASPRGRILGKKIPCHIYWGEIEARLYHCWVFAM